MMAPWKGVGWVREDEEVDGGGAGGFAEDGDFSWVAAEGVDVALDPGEGEALVEEA